MLLHVRYDIGVPNLVTFRTPLVCLRLGQRLFISLRAKHNLVINVDIHLLDNGVAWFEVTITVKYDVICLSVGRGLL